MKELCWSEKIFLIFICTLFLLEGIGLNYFREFFYYIILILPLVLYSFDKYINHNWYYPKIIKTISFLLVITLSITTITSLDIELSLLALLLVLACFLIFIYVYSHAQNIQKYLLNIIIFFSLLFTFLSGFVFIFRDYLAFIMPSTGYQLISSPFGLHYHFGDFLLVIYTYLAYEYFFKKNSKLIPYLFITFLAIIASYSRSALVSAGIITFIINYKTTNTKGRFKSISIVVLGMVLFIFINVLFFGNNSADSTLVNSIKKTIDSEQKTLLGNREIYIGQGLKAIKDNSFFGAGLGNFKLISDRFSVDPNTIVETSHNIFIDTFVEGGTILLVLVLYLVFLFLKNSKNNFWKYIFIALLLNFLSDYTYRIYIFVIVLIISIAYSVDDNENESLSLLHGIFFGITTLSALIMFTTFTLLHFHYNSNWMFLMNPFNKKLSQTLIEKNIVEKDYESALHIMNISAKFHRGDSNYLEYLASSFENFANKKMAAFYYRKAFEVSNPRDYLFYIRKILFLDRESTNDIVLKRSFRNVLNEIYQKYQYQNIDLDSPSLSLRDKNKAIDSKRFLHTFFKGVITENQGIRASINIWIRLCREIDSNCQINEIKKSEEFRK